jgi:peptide-methionine (S)-S-oxide reductase
MRPILLFFVLAAVPALAAPHADVRTGRSSTAQASADTALFAGGCFWSMESGFEGRKGIRDVSSGYSGGKLEHPTYDDVNTETTGHMETVQVVFDPRVISYAQLLDLYWHRTNPLQADGQFCDHGESYHPAIFWRNERQRALAEASKAAVERQLKAPVVTYVRKAGPFWRAEEYHQDFYKKNSMHYHAYSMACGRDRKLDEMWGKQATHAVVP